jgi:hypothetical protein
MTIKTFAILPIIAIFLLTSCDKKVPQCSDSEVKKTVLSIFYEQIYNAFTEKLLPSRQRAYYTKERLDEEMANLQVALFKQYPGLDPSKTRYEVDSIRTVNKNAETGAYVCAGIVKSYNKATKEKLGEANIAYAVELTDDKKSFYVTLEMQ